MTAIPELLRLYKTPWYVTADGIKDANGVWIMSATNVNLANQIVELANYQSKPRVRALPGKVLPWENCWVYTFVLEVGGKSVEVTSDDFCESAVRCKQTMREFMDSINKGTKAIITNIIDERENQHKFKDITAIVEATWHDNSCEGADQSEPDDAPTYDERRNISVSEAIKWAEGFQGNVTLFLS